MRNRAPAAAVISRGHILTMGGNDELGNNEAQRLEQQERGESHGQEQGER